MSALALLMPIAFGGGDPACAGAGCSHHLPPFGGMITLIGTPPNLVIASLWSDLLPGAQPLGMFDFAYVGGPVALIGLAFTVLIGWRFLPQDRDGNHATALFEKKDYLTEIYVPEGCPALIKQCWIWKMPAKARSPLPAYNVAASAIPLISDLKCAGGDLLLSGGPLALEEWLKTTGLQIQGAQNNLKNS